MLLPTVMDHAEVRPRGATPRPRLWVATQSARLQQCTSSGEELPHIRVQGWWPRGAMSKEPAARAQEGREELLHVQDQEGRRCPR